MTCKSIISVFHSFFKCSREFLKSENPQPETRPHSSPDPSCGREKSRGRANPFPQTNCFALPSPFRFLLRDFQQNTFELCPTNTARIRNSNFPKKYGRREAPSVLYSPHKILILKGFATLRVAQKVRFDL